MQFTITLNDGSEMVVDGKRIQAILPELKPKIQLSVSIHDSGVVLTMKDLDHEFYEISEHTYVEHIYEELSGITKNRKIAEANQRSAIPEQARSLYQAIAAMETPLLTAEQFDVLLHLYWPAVTLTPESLSKVLSSINDELPYWRNDSIDGLVVNIEKCLEWESHLDTPGDCPICHKSGWIRTDRHKACTKQIFANAKGRCRCGKRAVTIYDWQCMCDKCASIADHLDALAS